MFTPAEQDREMAEPGEGTPRRCLSRRQALGGAVGLSGAVALGVPCLAGCSSSDMSPWQRSGSGGPPVAGLHLQFGSDASREVVVSWNTTASVTKPRVMFGSPEGGLGSVRDAETVTYRDNQSGTEVQIHHARLTGLTPNSDYIYAALHDGASAEFGTVRTAPRGRAAFTFTSFGDQATPTLGRQNGSGFLNDNLGSPAAGDLTAGVERVAPLFHLVNGDLCYANLATDRVRTWSDWFANNGRSARHRPWMPVAGNHENERGNGPIGYGAYQSYFALPDSGADHGLRGLWYSFTAGAVRVIGLNNDDICYQDGGNTYVHGYSGGAQRAWLEKELRAARADTGIDWIVVCMHQVAVSTADQSNGADLGIREQWVPLFDQYGVDLVVCGHEHHYERSHPIRGQQPTDTRTPIPTQTTTEVLDTSTGTVHMVIGGGGTSAPTNGKLFTPAKARVLTAVGAVDPATSKKAPVYVIEDAPWSAVRDPVHPYGFAAFEVDPTGSGPTTAIHVTYYAVTGPYGDLTPVDRFTLTRPRQT
jgi:hypothetical protein